MLRLSVLALVLVNAAYFVWSQGLLQAFDLAPAQQTEPYRLGRQIKPEALRLLSAQELRQFEATSRAAAKPSVCLQAGLLDESQGTLLRTRLESTLPPGSWTLEAVVEPARWIVYMGPYANAAALAKKQAELAALKLRAEPLNNPALASGLSLGGYETQAAATAALGGVSRRGVRTARVVQERAELRGFMLRVPAADSALRSRLDDLKPVLAGKALNPCP